RRVSVSRAGTAAVGTGGAFDRAGRHDLCRCGSSPAGLGAQSARAMAIGLVRALAVLCANSRLVLPLGGAPPPLLLACDARWLGRIPRATDPDARAVDFPAAARRHLPLCVPLALGADHRTGGFSRHSAGEP